MFPRQGLPIKEMTEPQRKLAHELLQTGLSQRGYTTTTTIMSDLEAILRDTEAAARAAKPGAGPGDDARPRALLLHGLRHARAEGRAGAGASRAITSRCTSPSPTATPSSPRRRSGAPNPAEVREGPKKGLRTLDKEQDAGRALMMALDEAQKKTAIVRGGGADRHPRP